MERLYSEGKGISKIFLPYKRTPQKIFELSSNGSSAESEVPKFGSAFRRFCIDKSRS